MVGWLGADGLEIFYMKGCVFMIHIDSAQNLIQADLGKLQADMPDDFDRLRAMGFARKWSIILYPDDPKFLFNSKDDLLDCLYNYCVTYNLTACLSPLHDKDLLVDGSSEEEHYHFFTVSKAPEYAQRIASLCYALNGFLPAIKKVECELGYFRYFTHQDDLDKAEYDSADIVCFNDYAPPAAGNGSTQSATQELLELVDRFENLSELTSYVIHCRRDLFNVLLRSKNLIAVYYNNLD